MTGKFMNRLKFQKKVLEDKEFKSLLRISYSLVKIFCNAWFAEKKHFWGFENSPK